MNNALSAALQRLENSFRERAAQRATGVSHTTSASHATLPDMPAIRCRTGTSVNSEIPDTLALPLFDLDKRQQRIYLKGQSLAIPGIGRVSYRGQELRGDDWAVWSQIVLLVNASSHSQWISFSPYTMLRNLRWSNSRYDRMRLRACLERMQATVLRFPGNSPKSLVSLSLIERCEWIPSPKGRSGCWRLRIDTEIKKRFALPLPDDTGTEGHLH